MSDLTLHDVVLDRLSEAVALQLWEIGAIRVSTDPPFTLASGATSPLYINCRQIISHPGLVRLFVAAAALTVERRALAIDAIAGGETAGIPFAAFLARELGLPMLYVRKKPKGYGLDARVEGDLTPGARVLLVEDLITDGGSKVGFIEALRAAGGSVEHCLVLVDREQGGDVFLRSHHVALHGLVCLSTALTTGLAHGYIDDRALAAVRATFET